MSKSGHYVVLPMREFEAFGSLLRMAMQSTDDKQSIRQLLAHFQSLEKLATVERRQFPKTHCENDDLVTEPRIVLDAGGRATVIDVPINDEPTK